MRNSWYILNRMDGQGWLAKMIARLVTSRFSFELCQVSLRIHLLSKSEEPRSAAADAGVKIYTKWHNMNMIVEV
jgi:hypothetical protein